MVQYGLFFLTRNTSDEFLFLILKMNPTVIRSHKKRNCLLSLKPSYVPSIWSNLSYSHLILMAKLTFCLFHDGRKESTKKLEQPASITRRINSSVGLSPEQGTSRACAPSHCCLLTTHRQAHSEFPACLCSQGGSNVCCHQSVTTTLVTSAVLTRKYHKVIFNDEDHPSFLWEML